MKTKLVKELAKYYSRGGNKIVFRNGMTLNQLATEMWARLGFKEIDSSVLSRVIHGKRLFSLKQLEIFCDILKFSDNEKWDIQTSLSETVSSESGIKIDFYSSPYFLEMVDTLKQTIYQIRIQGNPRLAITLVDDLEHRLGQMLKKTSSESFIRHLQKTLALLLYEQATAYNDMSTSSDVFEPVNDICKKIQRIAKVCDDKELYGLSCICIGGAYYVMNKYDISIVYMKKALNYVMDLGEKLGILRTLSLNFTYLKEYNKYTCVEQKIKEIISSNKCGVLEQISQAYEGLARARGIFKIPNALNYIEEGWKVYRKINLRNKNLIISKFDLKIPMRAIQLTRSQLEIITRLEPKDNKTLEKVGVKGYQLALEYGYQRHARRIEEVLKRYL